MPFFNNFIAAAAVLTGLGRSCPMAHAAPTPGSSDLQKPNPEFVASGYFGGHHATSGAPVSSIPWEKYTDIKWAFAEPTADCQLNLGGFHPEFLPEFVAAGKKHGVKTQLSAGGWTGSIHISKCISTPESRTAFANTLINFVKQNQLDGFDIDFEYPNRKGLACNIINPNDVANLLAFFKEVRAHPDGKGLYLTAAGSLNPWNGPDGKPSTDVSGFADVLDYIMIMAYDIYGAWAPTGGPNAALRSSCDKRNTFGSLEDGVTKWLAAGLPADKTVVGIPFYGHGFAVNKTSAFTAPGVFNMYPPSNSSNRRQGSSWDNDPAVDPCGDAQPHAGTFPLWSLNTELGVVGDKAKNRKDITYYYDECSQTPALYDETNEWWISYDNSASIAVKAKYAKDAHLKGFCGYEIGGDFENQLINGARLGAGLP